MQRFGREQELSRRKKRAPDGGSEAAYPLKVQRICRLSLTGGEYIERYIDIAISGQNALSVRTSESDRRAPASPGWLIAATTSRGKRAGQNPLTQARRGFSQSRIRVHQTQIIRGVPCRGSSEQTERHDDSDRDHHSRNDDGPIIRFFRPAKGSSRSASIDVRHCALPCQDQLTYLFGTFIAHRDMVEARIVGAHP